MTRKTSLLIVLSLCLYLPSLAMAQKYLGTAGALLYLLAATTLSASLFWRLEKATFNKARLHQAATLAVLTLLCLAYLIIFPRANSQIPGQGSDRDDALNVAVTELIAGRYPYSARTYHDNPISPLPGAILFATPFVLLGNSALQTLTWLIALVVGLYVWTRPRPAIGISLLLALTGSIALWYALVTGSDLIANTLYVAVLGACWVEAAVTRTQPRRTLLFAVLFGIALASRINFALVLPPLAAMIAYRRSGSTATLTTINVTIGVRYAIPVVLAFLAVTVPFYLANPAEFTPLTTGDEISFLDQVMPYAGTVMIPVLMLIATAIICLPRFARQWHTLLYGLAAVQAIPVLIGTILISVYNRQLVFSFLIFGTTFMIFGFLATVVTLCRLKTD